MVDTSLLGTHSRGAGRYASVAVVILAGLFVPGCERKEKLLEIETPHRRIEVERTVKPDKPALEPSVRPRTAEPAGKVNVDVNVNRKEP